MHSRPQSVTVLTIVQVLLRPSEPRQPLVALGRSAGVRSLLGYRAGHRWPGRYRRALDAKNWSLWLNIVVPVLNRLLVAPGISCTPVLPCRWPQQ